MKVQKLVEFVGNPKNKMLKQDQLQIVLQKQLEVKDYISIKDKKKLVDSIIDECILFEDGIYKFDDIDKYICFVMKTIAAYTNLELSDNIEEDYDILCSAKILDFVINTFKKEYDDVNILLQMKCDYILSGNTIEAQIGRFLNGLSDKVDVLITALSDKFSNFDFNKLPVGKKDLNKLISFLNIQK